MSLTAPPEIGRLLLSLTIQWSPLEPRLSGIRVKVSQLETVDAVKKVILENSIELRTSELVEQECAALNSVFQMAYGAAEVIKTR